MNRNYLIGFVVAAVLLGAIAFLAWSLFEIRPVTKPVPPSREARLNEYLALDRWLAGMGRSVRTERSGDLSMISRAEETHLFIQASVFFWDEEAVEYLPQWIEEGGELFLALDNFRENEKALLLLEEFGIEVKMEIDGSYHNSGSPDFGGDVSFSIADNGEAAVLKDGDGFTRLVQVKRGRGKLTVTGRPLFLQSHRIGSVPNASLAWSLFVNGREKDGILFIRGAVKNHGLFGYLFRQGNLIVLVVSVLVLLVVGFWAVIPRFGLSRADDERPGRPLRERFLAEGRFLKQCGALEFYRDVYIKEIKRRLARREGIPKDEETYRRVMELWQKTEGQKDGRMLAEIFNGASFRYRDFPKIILMLKILLERI